MSPRVVYSIYRQGEEWEGEREEWVKQVEKEGNRKGRKEGQGERGVVSVRHLCALFG